MGNVYKMPLIIKRGETKVKNLGLQSYFKDMSTVGIFEDSNQYIDFGEATHSYAFFEGNFHLGAKNVELRNTKSSSIDYWGIPYNSVLSFIPVSSNDSFKYSIIRILVGEGVDFATTINLFATDFAESKGFKSSRDDNYPAGYPDEMTIVNEATLYPFIYDQGKLTTYSVKAPNSTNERNRRGTEPLALNFGNGYWSVNDDINASWSDSDYQDYANKLITHLGSHTRLGVTLEFGFLGILRGNLPSNWTPRRHILWFLQRCTNIDTTNDWTHIQLT